MLMMPTLELIKLVIFYDTLDDNRSHLIEILHNLLATPLHFMHMTTSCTFLGMNRQDSLTVLTLFFARSKPSLFLACYRFLIVLVLFGHY